VSVQIKKNRHTCADSKMEPTKFSLEFFYLDSFDVMLLIDIDGGINSVMAVVSISMDILLNSYWMCMRWYCY